MQATFQGKVSAEKNNPFQSEIEFVFTDFAPNKNNQAIPRAEAENIIASARLMPIKIRLVNDREGGHAYSVPIGTIAELWLEDEVIKGRAIIWNSEFEKEDTFLRKTIAERDLFTSWEIYYQTAEVIDGVEYLHGCTASGTVIVDNPAYGKRTPILSYAESSPLEELRKFLCLLLDELWEIEDRQEKLDALQNSDEAFAMLESFVAYLKGQQLAMSETHTSETQTLETRIAELQSELDRLNAERVASEKALAEQNLYDSRVRAIAEIGAIYSEEDSPRDFILSFTDESFSHYLNSLKRQRSVASASIKVPDTVSRDTSMSTKDLAQLLLNEGKN